jgi:murein DD-endopeptidase MepM/ murein hydrolase activator NlpD
MEPGMKFLVFSKRNFSYKEIKLFRLKIIGSSLVLGTLFFIGLLALNRVLRDPLGLGYDRMSLLSTENRLLKEQVSELSKSLTSLQTSLATLSDRGNELRLVVDLPKIDEDTREAAVGGTARLPELALLSPDGSKILGETRNLIDKLQREVKLQQASYQEVQQRFDYNRTFFAHLPAIKPMEGYYEINGFGMRVHPVLRVYRMHEGIDIINDVGKNVYATGDGVVRFCGHTEGGYGMVVEISHGYGYTSLYAHLSSTLVREGQSVRRGDLIAKSGRSGLVSGPHLHYEVSLNGRKLNPVDYFFDDIDASHYRSLLASVK